MDASLGMSIDDSFKARAIARVPHVPDAGARDRCTTRCRPGAAHREAFDFPPRGTM